MSEKQFDIFDDHFKDAAEHYEPGFSEDAWQKMEAKLDQKNKRRRMVGWWWWISDALMVSLLLYMAVSFNKQDSSPENNVSENKQEQKITGSEQKIIGQDNDNKENISERSSHLHKSGTDKYADKEPNLVVNRTSGDTKTVSNTSSIPGVKNANSLPATLADRDASSKQEVIIAASEQKNIVQNKTVMAENNSPYVNGPSLVPNSGGNNGLVASENKSIIDSVAPELQKQVSKNDSAILTSTNKPDPGVTKNNIPFKKGFFLHAGYAPEKSYVKGNEIGPLSYAYGGGIGFSFAPRWSLLAGIYTTKKDYTAGGDDYNPKYNSYYYNLKLYSVDASCKITELPLSVNYAVLQKPKHSIIAGVGIASLIMKKEWYDYHYERANGMYGRASHTYKTNNVHLFATAMLNAGYQYNITKHLSVTASPYIKLPLYGVGEGRVKISSAGILTGVIYKLPSLHKK